MAPILRAAACHAAPIFLSAKETTQKCVTMIEEAAKNQADIVIFPEVFIPGYPFWSCMVAPGEAHEFFKRMVSESVYADGEEINMIRKAAKEFKITVCVGISEKTRHSSANLYNSNLMISSAGEILVHHRKLVPTFYEKLTWAPGDGHGLKVIDLPVENGSAIAKVGMLLCGENTNPLARYSMMAQGEQVHISTWPAKAPMHSIREEAASVSSDAEGEKPKAKYGNVAANRIRAAGHCFEGKCFGIINAAIADEHTLATMLEIAPDQAKEVIRTTMAGSMQAETRFLDPSGSPLMGFVINAETGEREEKENLQHEEGILYADLDMTTTIEGKQFQDVVGGYQRFDVFQVKVDRSRQTPVTFTNSLDPETR
ncbi:nitrilase [Penicillium pulvis]|uniref:nitrilase n=1 Tax=Penicillium pulvis TaxID=1562058 RepID=UPI002548D2BC|nr:nitrilase [Penicillium pulvis]KAJ5809814.1 nitrilase [Penicillium pulvis]